MYGLEGSTRTADAGSLADLVADCREIAPGVFPPANTVIDLTVKVPAPRAPEGPDAPAIDIRDSVVRLLDGFGDYGS